MPGRPERAICTLDEVAGPFSTFCVMQWQFGTADAALVTTPVLVVEGAEGRRMGDLSQQVTEAAMKLFPGAEVASIENANHMLPLQDPEALSKESSGLRSPT